MKKNLNKQEKLLNKKFHYIFCYEPGMERQEFEVKFKYIPKLIQDLTNAYNKNLCSIEESN